MGCRAWEWKTIVKFIKSAILAGAVAMAIAVGFPAEGAVDSGNRGSFETRDSADRGSSGEGSESTPPPTSSKSSSATRRSNHNASSGVSIPEPSNLLMLGLGVVGLIAGRIAAKRRKKT